MEENKTTPANAGTGRSLGIAGMVLGIVAIVVSFIPCFGWWAILMAIVGVVLSSISMNQAKKVGAPKSMAMAGLICSILAIVIGCAWLFIFAEALTHVDDAAKMIQESAAMDSFNKALEQLQNTTDTIPGE
jgi:predicted PurR-regulated permease PerM